MAYFGQLCHCMSHTPNNRPEWVNILQKAGIMISPKEHGKHHQTYDDNFCIGCGLCNGILSWSRKNVTSNKWAWLVFFFAISLIDVPVMNYLLTKFVGFV
jgi:NAD-dependent dihydropyrimidine dehydrogenase PreA subunit